MSDAVDAPSSLPGPLAGERIETIRRVSIRRHSVPVRIAHWVNVICLTLLLMSGLQIFNAHPALYWGQQSHFDDPILAMTSTGDGDAMRGITNVGTHQFDTTGFLGASPDSSGELTERGFPSWLTVPSGQDLTTGRRWHFFFAWLFVINGLVYLLYTLVFSRHASRDLLPASGELRTIPRSIWNHLCLRFPKGEEAKHYNVLQKLTYLIVIFVLLPVMVLAGLSMSPGMDATLPFLPQMFGGRQSARTVHFAVANLLVIFVIVHVAMVILSGVWNNLRSMISGRYVIDERTSRAD